MSALIKLLIAVICCFAVASTAFPNRDDFVEVNTGKKGAYMLAMQRVSTRVVHNIYFSLPIINYILIARTALYSLLNDLLVK